MEDTEVLLVVITFNVLFVGFFPHCRSSIEASAQASKVNRIHSAAPCEAAQTGYCPWHWARVEL